jgi:hypothetical protein
MNITPEDFRDKLYNNEPLPRGLVVAGSVWVLCRVDSPVYLPEDLTINGALTTNLNCEGVLSLPKGLIVKSDLNLDRCIGLVSMAGDLKVLGNLSLIECNSLGHLPSSITVDGNIYCERSLIDKIPLEDLPLYLNFSFSASIHDYITTRTLSYDIRRMSLVQGACG